MGLVVTQDFGTAALTGLSATALLFLAGVPVGYLLGLLAVGGAGAAAFVAHSPYRLARITAMFDVWATSNPSTYQPRQSLLAVMTGGYFGKGLGEGMIKRGYLPEAQTDFIFATYCEEWGLVGAVLLLGLLAVWLVLAGRAADAGEDRFGRLLCGALGFSIGLQAVLHVAVDLVAAPPTGMGLPFISAGGTSLLLTTASAALMISVTARGRPRGLLSA